MKLHKNCFWTNLYIGLVLTCTPTQNEQFLFKIRADFKKCYELF